MIYKEDGFTLIELLIVISILGIIISAVGGVLVTGWKAEKYNREELDLRVEGRIIMLRLPKDIREASEIDSTSSDYINLKNSSECKRYKYDSNNNSIEYWEISIAGMTDVNGDGWPDDWGSASRVFAERLIKSGKFNRDGREVDIEIELSNDNGGSYKIKDKAYLRVE